jgi:hypothetical protein
MKYLNQISLCFKPLLSHSSFPIHNSWIKLLRCGLSHLDILPCFMHTRVPFQITTASMDPICHRGQMHYGCVFITFTIQWLDLHDGSTSKIIQHTVYRHIYTLPLPHHCPTNCFIRLLPLLTDVSLFTASMLVNNLFTSLH